MRPLKVGGHLGCYVIWWKRWSGMASFLLSLLISPHHPHHPKAISPVFLTAWSLYSPLAYLNAHDIIDLTRAAHSRRWGRGGGHHSDLQIVPVMSLRREKRKDITALGDLYANLQECMFLFYKFYWANGILKNRPHCDISARKGETIIFCYSGLFQTQINKRLERVISYSSLPS